MTRLDYDPIAPTYDHRYTEGGPAELTAFVRDACESTAARGILEVGCGTGRWLAEECRFPGTVAGVDRSREMLRYAHNRAAGSALARALAEALPFRANRFALALCVNAIHHFTDPRTFVCEAARVTSPGGSIIVVALAPHDGHDRWYLYDYFPGTREDDVERYPATERIRSWMDEFGLTEVRTDVVARLRCTRRGSTVFEDPILTRTGTSQLARLDDTGFEEGMARIREVARRRPAEGFETDLRLFVTRGRKPHGSHRQAATSDDVSKT